MDTPGIGRKVISYLQENTTSIVATTAVAGGWTAAAVIGKQAVVATCLVGGGMFATVVAHEVLKGAVKVGSNAARGLINGIRTSFKEKPPAGVMTREEPAIARM